MTELKDDGAAPPLDAPVLRLAVVDGEDLAAIVHDVVVDRVAHLLGRDPDDVDPHYEED